VTDRELEEYLNFWEDIIKVEHTVVFKTNANPQGNGRVKNQKLDKLLPNHM